MLTSNTTPPSRGPKNPGLTPVMLHHAAWVTHDVAATADFYTRIMGMELASTVIDDKVPSTGADFPYFHIFFRMGDGSTIAFFESPGVPLPAKASHPAYDTFNHFAMQANTREDVMRWHEWLLSNGIEVVGPTDHKGLILSIYFRDPNGIRLEITTPIDADWNRHTKQGYKDLETWVACKESAQREGRDVGEALVEMIRETRKRYEKKEAKAS
jgi:catechol 2,3-dioxygenase-like lactoylglutathione lyase family enzyme